MKSKLGSEVGSCLSIPNEIEAARSVASEALKEATMRWPGSKSPANNDRNSTTYKKRYVCYAPIFRALKSKPQVTSKYKSLCDA